MNWIQKHRSIWRRTALLLFTAAIFISGWSVGQGRISFATSHNVSAASTLDHRQQAVDVQNVYERIKNSYAQFSSREELISYARGICLKALTHREVCMTTPINIKKTPGASAITSFNLNAKENYGIKIDIDPSLLQSNPNESAFVLTHEWNHIELALITGNVKKYRAMMDRAVYYYKTVDGKPITRTRAMEVQTDCMALLHSNQPWIGGYPGYLRGIGSVGKDPYDANYACRNWKDVLYGDPTVDYHAVSTPTTNQKVAVK